MKNPFEKHFQNPRPDNESQFEQLDNNSEVELLNDALFKAEGFILYAPVSEEVKEALLGKLTDISENDVIDFRGLLANRTATPENCAATIIQRRLRFVVQDQSEVLSETDFNMLQLGVERLTDSGPASFDDLYKSWMNNGSAS